jgi:hypothetical protein
MNELHPPKLSDKIRLSNAALYERTLHLFLNLYPVEGSPLASAFGVSLFLRSNDLRGLKTIYEQLDRELGSLSCDPTDETDLPSKTLSLIAYHGLCQHQDFEEHLSLSVVNDYLSFASREGWFRMSEVAHFTYELAQDMRVAEDAGVYFQSNIRNWIHERVIDSTCQGLHILREKISSAEAVTALDLLENQAIKNLTIDELAWILVGLTGLSTALAEPTMQIRIMGIVEGVQAELSTRVESALVHNEADIGFQGVIHLIQTGSATMDEVQRLVQKLSQDSQAIIKGVDLVEGGILLTTNDTILSAKLGF